MLFAHDASAFAKDCHFGSPSHGLLEASEETWKKQSCEDEDSTNIDELSELFSSMEEDNDGDQAVDFSVFIEDEDALNVEEVSDVFTALEDVDPQVLMQHLEQEAQEPVVSEQDVEDAENIDLMADLFTSLEQEEPNGVVEQPAAQATVQDTDDAENVDLLADLFTSLEDLPASEQSAMASTPVVANEIAGSKQDWIDSLAVDSMSNLFSELEEQNVQELAKTASTPVSTPSLVVRLRAPLPAVQPRAPVVDKVDSRIFVPKFSVRIEGQRPSMPSRLPVQTMLAGPPCFLAGPPSLPTDASREHRVGRWLEKRKARSWISKPTDSSISETRRACAAKRQRVKGRFTSEKNTFVSITALQQ
ncbi:TPA: hypothetical protein N0F65_009031 [Lagenidium giganteum]|uniref:CCT domain-containing protein n=1 Tax=Lagenidium giganteum TaxID=4803 RepID=A0AAV2YVN6_9STRA|nr:TPA: hypothetical protein N0F65_009031 [Lagenidium giganteum]